MKGQKFQAMNKILQYFIGDFLSIKFSLFSVDNPGDWVYKVSGGKTNCSLFMGYRQQSAPIIISLSCSRRCSVIVKVKIIITSDCFTGP